MQKGWPAGSANTYSGSSGSSERSSRIVAPRASARSRCTRELVDVRDGEVEVELLGDLWVGPRRAGQLGDPLDGQPGVAGPVPEHEPIVALRVGLAGRRRLVAGPVRVTKELPVELGDLPGVRLHRGPRHGGLDGCPASTRSSHEAPGRCRGSGTVSRITRKPRWSELPLRQKATILAFVAVQAALAAAAQRDLSARSAGQVRGPKLVWRLLTMNTLGAMAYFAAGRR